MGRPARPAMHCCWSGGEHAIYCTCVFVGKMWVGRCLAKSTISLADLRSRFSVRMTKEIAGSTLADPAAHQPRQWLFCQWLIQPTSAKAMAVLPMVDSAPLQPMQWLIGWLCTGCHLVALWTYVCCGLRLFISHMASKDATTQAKGDSAANIPAAS